MELLNAVATFVPAAAAGGKGGGAVDGSVQRQSVDFDNIRKELARLYPEFANTGWFEGLTNL